MSLINDMLNDLDERRNQQQRQETSLDWMSGQKINRKKQWMLPLIITIAILLLLVFGFGIWRLMQTADMAAVDKLAALNQSPSNQSALYKHNSAVVVEAEVVSAKAETITSKTNTVEKSSAEKKIVENDAKAEAVVTTETGVAISTDTVAVEKSAAKIKAAPSTESVPAAQQRSNLVNNTASKTSSKAATAVKVVEIKTDRPLSMAQHDIKQAKQAEMLIRDGRTAKAEDELQQFLQINPQAERSAELLASLWLSQQRFDRVETLLTSLKEYNARSVGLQKIEARLYMLTGRNDQAVDVLMAGHPAIELHADYYVLLGLAARQTQQYRLSAEAYSGLLAFDASQGDWWVGLAIALDLQEETTAAREAYRRALELRKISPALRSYAEQRLR